MRGRILPLAVLIFALTLAACGNGAASPSAPAPAGGDAAAGKALFNQPSLANGPGCNTCHSLEAGKTIVGPSVARIATTAAEAIQRSGYKGSATNAAEYLREAIISPDAYVEEGFAPGVMPKNFKDLSPQEVDDLVAYLLTLK